MSVAYFVVGTVVAFAVLSLVGGLVLAGLRKIGVHGKPLAIVGVAGLLVFALPASVSVGLSMTQPNSATPADVSAPLPHETIRPLSDDTTTSPATDSPTTAPTKQPTSVTSSQMPSESFDETPQFLRSSQTAAKKTTTRRTTTRKPTAKSVYYRNCAAVRAARKAPLYRGQPGYRAGLDADNDGIACEPSNRKPAPKPTRTTAKPRSVYYKNCTEVRKAGKAPLYRGQPGYRSALDRDHDGIACE